MTERTPADPTSIGKDLNPVLKVAKDIAITKTPIATIDPNKYADIYAIAPTGGSANAGITANK